MEGFESILNLSEINDLFPDEDVPVGEEKVEEASQQGEEKVEETNEEQTTEVTDSNLFEEDVIPESVGSEENKEGAEGSTPEDGGGTSPNNNFYSSIANAMAEDGIFPNLTEEDVQKVDSAESLSEAIEQEVAARVDEVTRRVDKALKNGVEPNSIKAYEEANARLNSITDKQLLEDTDEGEQLRKSIIYQDFLNRGYSKEKAAKFAERSVQIGNDLEDSKEALQSLKEQVKNDYNALLVRAEEEANEATAKRKKEVEKLKKSLYDDEDVLGGIEVSKDIRKKAYENITKPIYKDSDTGEYLTAIQKYQKENPSDFLKYVSLTMALTHNFKDFDALVKKGANKVIKKGLRELEHTLNSTQRNNDGSLKVVTSRKSDPESLFGSGNIKLAL